MSILSKIFIVKSKQITCKNGQCYWNRGENCLGGPESEKHYLTCSNYECEHNDQKRCKCTNGIILGADGKCCRQVKKEVR